MSHSHNGHDHTHEHGKDAGRSRLMIAFGLTLAMLVAEVIGAVLTGSLALLVDAAHMATDAVGLFMALMASLLIARPATSTRTWGLRRAEVLSAAAQSLVLLGVGVYAVIEGVSRLFEPAEIPSQGLLVFGVIGLVVNVIAIMVLTGGRDSSLNLRAAFLEVINDALGSVAVIVSAVVIALTGWAAIDTILGLLIAAMIAPRAIRILASAVRMLMEVSPRRLDMDRVRVHLSEGAHVRGVHDLHATEIGTGLPVLTAHVELDPDCFRSGDIDTHLDELRACMREHFDVSVEHATFQLEPIGYGAREALPHV